MCVSEKIWKLFAQLNTATTAKPGGMRHVLHAWMESGSRYARLSCINEDNCICYVAVRETDIANSWQNVSKTKNINLLKIWVDCCNSCADVNIKMHINRCFLVRTGIILKVIKHMKEMQNFANHISEQLRFKERVIAKTVQKDVQMGMTSCITSKNFVSTFMAIFCPRYDIQPIYG